MLRLLFLLAFVPALLSCGTKGPLTLPKPAAAAAAPAPATIKDNAKPGADKLQ
jgi:predicted small lipoprotein YifL